MKCQDLIRLCDTGAIPKRFHEEYHKLPNDSNVRETLNETNYEEEDDEKEDLRIEEVGSGTPLCDRHKFFDLMESKISRNRALICHSCWVRADRNAHHFVSAPSGSSTSVYETSEQEELTLQSTPQATLQSTSQDTLQSTSQDTLQSTSQVRSQDTLQSTSQATLQSTSQDTLQSTSQATLQSTSQATLQSTSQATLQSTSQDTLQSTSQDTLHSTSQATSEATPRLSEAIVLPDYVRAVETESRCFIEGCRRQERNRVPVTTRKMLLDVYNFYIPKNNRLCNHHINTQSWDFLTGALENYVNVFTALHIQNMLEFKSHSNVGLDFINILNMEDRLVHHWLGFTKEQYQRILDEVPQLLQKSSGPIGLTAYLI
ncbi:unnamed protein product [Parnassius apollo]|uniref:(apollo) hypothetical protein n=1 Tax=Parnassius apollo TaxID=110799 RepID=A0A8S3XIL8_PARAO|nr:unnamed protein product [Parnassius apollo]